MSGERNDKNTTAICMGTHNQRLIPIFSTKNLIVLDCLLEYGVRTSKSGCVCWCCYCVSYRVRCFARCCAYARRCVRVKMNHACVLFFFFRVVSFGVDGMWAYVYVCWCACLLVCCYTLCFARCCVCARRYLWTKMIHACVPVFFFACWCLGCACLVFCWWFLSACVRACECIG